MILYGGGFDDEEATHNIKLMEQAIKFAYDKYSATIKECNTDKGTQFYNSTFNKNGERHFGEFELFLEKQKINHIPSRRNHPQTNGKKERWFQEYKKHRDKFNSAKAFRIWFNNRIHGALNYQRGETPEKAFMKRLNLTIWIGLNFERIGL